MALHPSSLSRAVSMEAVTDSVVPTGALCRASSGASKGFQFQLESSHVSVFEISLGIFGTDLCYRLSALFPWGPCACGQATFKPDHLHFRPTLKVGCPV